MQRLIVGDYLQKDIIKKQLFSEYHFSTDENEHASNRYKEKKE